MINKRLTEEQVEQMKLLVIKGVTPANLAEQFGIAISSVHNWKKKFEKDGIIFPSVRGRKPLNQQDNSQQNQQKPEKRNTPQLNPGSNSQTNHAIAATTKMLPFDKPFTIRLNGVSLQIDAGAKSVNIGRDSIDVDF